ncbi:MAG: hypothetical protein K0S47_4459, partial [Herbinix sp.]|jgi:hypothetical protein|nr:hypothetical protein [Herbinix sp.]
VKEMQLLVLILKKVELINDILKRLVDVGVKGGTILEGSGMAKELVDNEDLPIFDMLRHVLAEETDATSKVLLFVLRDEKVMTARQTIKSVVGDLREPNTGIMFAIPIMDVEGLLNE